jgi:hypothetical protein
VPWPAADVCLRRAVALWLVGFALVPLAAAGCGNGETRVVEIDASQFNRFVLRSNQPVLVNFYKDG